MKRRPASIRTTLALSALALTLIAPWAIGQAPDLITATRLAAEQGDADAQNNLGVMYVLGEGVPQDDAEAARWYRLAGEQGDAEAQYNLGDMYQPRHIVPDPQDAAEAVRWYRLAAEQGHARASYNLGSMYAPRRYFASGVPPDASESTRWYRLAGELFRLAAEQGDAEAQGMLGIMYGLGEGVPQDSVLGTCG